MGIIGYRNFSLLIILLTVFFSNAAFSASETDWISSYDLTPTQIAILEKMSIEKKHTLEFLKGFAEAIEKYNKKKNQEIYIPPHTQQNLDDVNDWGAGYAYAYFAKFAGYTFNVAEFEKDCPNWALFGFGYYTYTQYLKVDVLQKMNNKLTELAFLKNQNTDQFAEEFLKRAQKDGFDKYLSPLP